MPIQPEKTEHLLRDLAIFAQHRELRPVYRLREEQRVAANGRQVQWDFVARAGKETLAQSILARLLTPRGELAALGHPEYGSRVHELIGRENNGAQRNLLKLYILEALQNEPRIERVVELEVIPSPGTRGTVDVSLRVKPVGVTALVQIGPFRLELEV
jgi:phage baseplate assembly protein W